MGRQNSAIVIRISKTAAITLALVAAVSIAYFTGVKLNAQNIVGKMRCSQIELAGMAKYDVVKKKITGVRKKVVLNRCANEEVVCYHTFDQSGSLTCSKL